uniref:C-type lectin domain-containing protein n=1 Tax=Seriola dumerili TaxID=41447 RepID=A0A3B4T798_SERDU
RNWRKIIVEMTVILPQQVKIMTFQNGKIWHLQSATHIFNSIHKCIPSPCPCFPCLFSTVLCKSPFSSDKFCLITEEKNWRQAQSYCREHHTDLASGDQLEDDKLKEEIQDSDELWIGLFRDTWTWSDGSNFSFSHWDQGPFGDGRGQKNYPVVTGFIFLVYFSLVQQAYTM